MTAVKGGESVGARILIVEDDLVLVRGLKPALERQGYVVRAAERSADAVDTAVHFHPDLVLLDVMMPEVDGWSVLARLRANPVTAQAPVIMVTAKDAESEKVRGFSLGADDYVTKPFSLQELRCRIAAVLRRSAPKAEEPDTTIPVVEGDSGVRLLRSRDVYYVEGIRNYTYVHTFDARYLSRLTLGALEDRGIDTFMRIHRSYIVNMEHVNHCGWANKSSYRIRMGDLQSSDIPVSRTLVTDVQRRLGLKT